MGTQSVLCPVCQGVLPASGKEAYTALRGRLIVTNGYCSGGCAERRAEAAEQTQQMARPQPAVGPEPAGSRPEPAPVARQAAVAGGRPGGLPLRVVR
ncbi:hypothetical protein [Nonomuraea sp. NPDC049480]|uniref:hypothetical protein n=1 Tax=Nonomuraea sp. NPDC049480 TaxID=3364353 RepID=UPI0037942323